MTGRSVLMVAVAVLSLAGTATAGADGWPRLVGTALVPGDDLAVFEGPSGRQVTRRVGDEVVTGVRLAAVRRGAVDLRDAAGRVVTLRAGGTVRPEGPVGSGGIAGEGQASAHRRVRVVPGDEGAVYPVHVGRGARLAHARDGGRFAGLRLVGGPPDTPLARAGLRQGDLIVAVNGRDLDGDEVGLVPSLLETLEAAGESEAVLLEVRRGDEVLRLAVGDEPR